MSQQPQLIPMQTGDYLKQLRLERKLSLEKVAAALRLDEQLLADLEADRPLAIARVYRDGYVRNYASYLGIPEDEQNNLFEAFVRGQAALESGA